MRQFFEKHNLRPFQSSFLIYVHVLAVAAIIYLITHSDKILSVLPYFTMFWFLYELGITGGCHRLWSHKSYQASTPLKIFLMILNSGAFQGSIFHWSRDHRLHHKFSDTELDPHTMAKGFFYAHCGWLLVKKDPRLVEEGKKIDMSDLMNDKVVMWQKKHYLPMGLLMCFIVPTLTYTFGAGVPIWAGFLLSMMTYAITLNITWFVNSVCHMFGSRPWNKNILPTDNFLVSILAQGEGYHNYHHEYPGDWRASKDEWYMINLTARFIELMAKFKLATVKM